MRAPAVPVPAWVQTVTRAQRRCECVGSCGTPHPASEIESQVVGHEADTSIDGLDGVARTQRCPAGPALPVVQLVVGPRDVTVAPADTWRLAVDDLAAWCPECFSGTFRGSASGDGRRRAASSRPEPL